MVRDNRHDSVHIFGAICPARGIAAGLIMPAVNTEAMNEHLTEISAQAATGAHCLLLCDGAGWHQRGERLVVPDNITLMSLPPYAPELNPMENVWDYLRGNKLSSRVWNTYQTMRDACKKLGTSSQTTQNASNQSEPEIGRRSRSRAVGISRQRFKKFRMSPPMDAGRPPSSRRRVTAPTPLDKTLPPHLGRVCCPGNR